MDGERTIDDVLATVFRAPHSYTGEDSVEISCHGSAYIVSEILRLAQAAGARMAEPGEFTIRAYLAGKLDLSQAEAVADLIASSSRAAHALATGQMRGGYSAALESLRQNCSTSRRCWSWSWIFRKKTSNSPTAKNCAERWKASAAKPTRCAIRSRSATPSKRESPWPSPERPTQANPPC